MTCVMRLRYALLVYTPTLSLPLETRGRGLRLIRRCSVCVRCELVAGQHRHCLLVHLRTPGRENLSAPLEIDAFA